jgi:hypothetical protein
VLEDVGAVGEDRRHLGGALEVESAVVAEPVGVEPVLLETDAEEDVVRVVVVGLEEVRVVRRDDGESEVLPQPEDEVVEAPLLPRLVGLDLEVVAALEELRVPGGGGAPSPAMQALETMSPSWWAARSSRSTRGFP